MSKVIRHLKLYSNVSSTKVAPEMVSSKVFEDGSRAEVYNSSVDDIESYMDKLSEDNKVSREGLFQYVHVIGDLDIDTFASLFPYSKASESWLSDKLSK